MNTNGFNLIGYATSPTGLGEDLRSFAAMLNYLELPFSVIDVPTEVQGQVNVGWERLTTEDYATTVFFMAANECKKLAEAHPMLFRSPRKKIGYFLWELPDFPQEHVPSLRLVDDIWCPTRFVQQAFFAKSRQITLALPLPVVQHESSGRDFKKELRFAKDAFVVMYMFDIRSTINRKNPHAVLRVFLNFLKTHKNAYLILKVNRWQQMGKDALDWIPKNSRIKIVKETLSPAEISDLYQCADCYLSLHRSEGFGRTLVEALQHGLYVVSTDFSGPKDFLTSDNALLVEWEKVAVNKTEYPNLTMDSWWSNPSEESALMQLKRAYELSRKKRNSRGQEDAKEFTHEALANRYRRILKTYLKP